MPLPHTCKSATKITRKQLLGGGDLEGVAEPPTTQLRAIKHDFAGKAVTEGENVKRGLMSSLVVQTSLSSFGISSINNSREQLVQEGSSGSEGIHSAALLLRDKVGGERLGLQASTNNMATPT